MVNNGKRIERQTTGYNTQHRTVTKTEQHEELKRMFEDKQGFPSVNIHYCLAGHRGQQCLHVLLHFAVYH